MSTKTRKHHHHDGHSKHAEMPQKAAASPVASPNGTSAERSVRSIEVRAYELWEQAGRPNDDESRVRFWLEAERELTGTR